MVRKTISIRFSEEEISTLRERAAICGMKYTRWCRDVTLSYHPRSSVELDFVKQLKCLGHNVNQMAKLAHLGQLDAAAAEELRQIKASLDLLLEVLW